MDIVEDFQCQTVINSICNLNWADVTTEELTEAAVMYYYFSIQFRENLQIARQLYPDDVKLKELEEGECNTDNLSPWPGVAQEGERLNHDEFMRRALDLSPIDDARRAALNAIGQSYLNVIRDMEPQTRARSIASYEDGGLEQVFAAILTAPQWSTSTLKAFRHFLTEHIRFDHDPTQGHGALARHLGVGDDVIPVWVEFKRLFVQALPRLAS